jgi:hypothetical protein
MQQLQPIDLEDVSGGVNWAAVRAVGRRVPVANLGFALWDGYSGYSEAREQGKGVGESLGNGAKEAVKGAVMYDLWGPTPAY